MILAVLVAYLSIVVSAIAGWRGLGFIALFGAPVAGLLGWWFTPAATTGSWRMAFGVGLGIGTLAAPLGAWTLAYVTLLSDLAGINTNSSTGGAREAVIIATLGLPISAIALPLTVPCGVVWAILVRGGIKVVDSREVAPTSLSVVKVAIVLIVVALGAVLVPVATGR